MVVNFLFPATSDTSQPHRRRRDHHGHKRKNNTSTTARQPQPTKPLQSSWEQFKSLLSCRTTPPSQVHDPSTPKPKPKSKPKPLSVGTCGSSICGNRDVVHGKFNESTDESALLTRTHQPCRSGGLPKLSGCYECYECRAFDVDPLSRKYPRQRAVFACSDCGEVFTKTESLDLHQILRHAVSELGPQDSGRSILEMIFKSSWHIKDRPTCTIERVLKVHNTQRTITRFEDYRDAVKARALPGPGARPSKKNPRCAADGNELLRFRCTTLACPLGSRGSTSLCISSSSTSCGVCGIIRHGFGRHGLRTNASSGQAHECCPTSVERRAMIVCRVIAGRVKRAWEEEEDVGYDSVAGDYGEQHANLEELFVSNPRAILPCFVVIYRALG